MQSAMSILLALNGLGAALIAIFAFFIYFRNKKAALPGSLRMSILLFSAVYLATALMHSVWLFGITSNISSDIILLQTFTLLSTIFILSRIFHEITGRAHLTILVLFYAVAALGIIVSNLNIMLLFVLSHIFLMLMFLDMLLYQDIAVNEMAASGFLYALLSLTFSLLVLYGYSFSIIPWFLSSAFMLGLLYFLKLELEQLKTRAQRAAPRKINQMHYTIRLAKFLGFIASFILFIFIGTVALHELGHALLGHWYHCDESQAILYDRGLVPHTILLCPESSNIVIVTFGGLALPLFMGLLLLLSANAVTRHLSLAIAATSILISHRDFLDLSMPFSLVILSNMIALFVLTLTLISFSYSYYQTQRRG